MNGLKVVDFQFSSFPAEGSCRNPDLLDYPAGKQENNYLQSVRTLLLQWFPVVQLPGLTITKLFCFQVAGKIKSVSVSESVNQ